MAVDAGIERPTGVATDAARAEIRKRFGWARNPDTIERLTRECSTCFALPSRWCKAGYGKRFSDATGFLHEDR